MKTEMIINKILGTKKKFKDSDGDGVTDKKDCQPLNPMRQDMITAQGLQRLDYNRSENNYIIKKQRDMENSKRII